MRKKIPFPFLHENQVVTNAFGLEARRRLRERTETYVSLENVQHFTHGRAWQSHNSSDPDGVSELKQLSHETVVKNVDIMLGRLEVVETTLTQLVEALQSSFENEMFATLSDTCDKHGNVVASGGQPASAYLEMLQKIEFGVGRDGQVSIPSLYAGAEAIAAFKRDPIFQSPEFIAEVERVTQLKIDRALTCEQERKSKFVGGG